MALAATLLLPLPVSFYYNDGLWPVYIMSASITLIVGAFLYFVFKNNGQLSHRDGFAVVTVGWFLFATLGTLPYLFVGTITNFVDAIFESMSGFTTTGSTILSNLDTIPKSLLFWRAETQWLGGMGIIVLTIAILPFLGVGGAQLFQAEVPGITKDKLTPKIRDTAKVLWGIYFTLTLMEVILLMLGGVSLFDAICHSFTTMATGGFSNYDASIAAFDSSYTHWIIIIFMFLAGANFALHYQACCGKPLSYLKSEEFRVYGLIFVFATIFFVYLNYDHYDNILINIRDMAFQVVSIGTSTGFATANFEMWPFAAQYILVLLMVVGSCSGSTGGGAKVVRFLIIVKHALVQLFYIIHPKGIKKLKIDHRAVPQNIIEKILGFFTFYSIIFFISTVILVCLDIDIVSSMSAVIACMSNIGPGLGIVGPTDNFAQIPQLGKVVLTFCMLIGRLEIFTILVVLSPSFWRHS